MTSNLHKYGVYKCTIYKLPNSGLKNPKKCNIWHLPAKFGSTVPWVCMCFARIRRWAAPAGFGSRKIVNKTILTENLPLFFYFLPTVWCMMLILYSRDVTDIALFQWDNFCWILCKLRPAAPNMALWAMTYFSPFFHKNSSVEILLLCTKSWFMFSFCFARIFHKVELIHGTSLGFYRF